MRVGLSDGWLLSRGVKLFPIFDLQSFSGFGYYKKHYG
jgi:hypothetical protein